VLLIITNKADIGADFVIRHLRAQGAVYLRIDTDCLGTPGRHFGFEHGAAILQYDNSIVRANQVKAIWARRFASPNVLDRAIPEYRDFVARELTDVMEAFLETTDAICMNSYEADRKSGNRLFQSALAKSVGFHVPEALVTQDIAKAKTFIGRFEKTITKAISFGVVSQELDQIAYTSKISQSIDLAGLAGCPILLQPNIEKRSEWRVTTVGEKVFAARTKSNAGVDETDWRRTPDAATIFEVAELPNDVSERLILLCERSGIVFGAHDLIETPSGDFYFLETNPAGQWAWLEVELGLPIGAAVASWLVSAGGSK
jgi:glutathione synthase/RimK-type ligase-like ATP-grasp enzyme